MSNDQLCGCNAVTGAGIMTSLQLMLLVITLSSSGIVLDRYRLWETYEPRAPINATEISTAEANNQTIKTIAGRWSRSAVEMSMAWIVGYGSFWLFSILILALSFKYYRPVFVVPNLTALLFGCIMSLVGFGVTLWRILDKSKNYRTVNYEDSMMCYLAGVLLFCFFACLIFIIFIFRYHKFLRLRYGHQVPKFVQSRARSGYPEENIY